MFSAHPTTDPGIIFWPKPTKKHTSELTLKIDDLKPRKNKKLVENRLPTGSPNPLKIRRPIGRSLLEPLWGDRVYPIPLPPFPAEALPSQMLKNT